MAHEADEAQAIAGFFTTRTQGEDAEQALLSCGFRRHEVSFLAGDTHGHQTPAIGPIQSVSAKSETINDACIGGIVGIAAGMIASALPGVGPLIAAGPIAGAVGMGIGATAGGIIGFLRDHGVSEEEAQFFAEGVKRGGSLVTVHGVPEGRADEARKILTLHGALDTEYLTKA
jgi:hypothetical protein